MKKTIYKALIICSVLISAISGRSSAQQLQIIHNCADPAAATVDIYVFGSIYLNDFNYHDATAFASLPPGTYAVGVAPSTSSSVADCFYTTNISLAAGQRYVVVASGVVDPNLFTPNPDGRAIDFSLQVFSNIQNTGNSGAGNTDLIIHHGSTDAIGIDVVPMGSPTILADNLSFGDISSYISLPATDHKVNLTLSNDNSLVVASYDVDLSSLGGGAAFVFAGGFYSPFYNQNGPALGLFAALPNGTVIAFPSNDSSRVQIIHNAADPAAFAVDVYLGNNLLLDNFTFRTATPFVTLPSNVTLNIGIAPSTSTSVADVIQTIPVNLQSGQTYAAVANGVLTPASFAANPDNFSTAFQLLLHPGVFESASNAASVRFTALHGVTDAPAVDVMVQGNPLPLVDNLQYAAFSTSQEVPNQSYVLELTPANNNAVIVGSYDADLTTLGGNAAVIFASGFLDPSQNQNGDALGLFAALPNGNVIQFPTNILDASVQLIHNAADPAATVVDVYAGSNLLVDNFAFRTATPFISVPSGVDVPIGIALSNSTSASDTIPGLGTTINLTAGHAYVITANGVLTPGSFAPNPAPLSRSTSFTYFVKDNAQQSATVSTNVDLTILHGVTDAPAVDVIADNTTTIANDIAYGDYTGYLSLPASTYILGVAPSAGTPILVSYVADLSALGGASGVVFASGFLDSTVNQNGASFGLFAALANGVVVELPRVTNARVQIIHNAADPAAASVDLYLGSNLLLDNFGFRSATPFVDIPAGVPLKIGIALSNSTTAADTIPGLGTTLNLEAGHTYAVLANGVLDPAMFAVNPDGRSTGFTYFIKDNAQEAGTGSNVDFCVVHGASDAPAVDVIASGASLATPTTIVNDASYSDITSYLSVPADAYYLDITPAAGSPVVATYYGDFTGLSGGAAVIFASGFLTPAVNMNGAPFGLYAAFPTGTVIPLQNSTGVTQLSAETFSGIIYPNPTSDFVRIDRTGSSSAAALLNIHDSTGRLVLSQNFDQNATSLKVDVRSLATGFYNISVLADGKVSTGRLVINR